MRRYTSLILSAVIILASAFLYAEEDLLFTYEAGDKRDPFVPLVDKYGKIMVTYGIINSIEDIILEGILYDDKGGSVVVLNDLVLKENNSIGKIKVERIERDKVILSFEDKEYVFKLKE